MYLGIDLGTSGVKALLIDANQAAVASATAPLSVSRPAAGWSEQNPADWILAAQSAVDAIRASHAAQLAAVRGIGLSGHMHGATLVDSGDRPLRPCILWNDTRSHVEAAELDANQAFRRISGNIVFPGFTAPKLEWVRRNEPEVFSRLRWVLLPKDYLRLWLSGEHMSEMSDAAGTSWLDTGQRAWSGELLAATGLSLREMPNLVEGTDSAGTLRGELTQRWGMSSGVVIAGGAGDNAAAACGLGAIADGRAFVSLGTSGVLFAANADYRPLAESAVHTFCHAVPATWHQMGVTLSATDCLNWLARISGSDAATLIGELGETLRAPGSATFLPYLGGERTPHNDAAIRGAFTGLEHGTDRAAMTQAVLEGVTFAIADSLRALNIAGTSPERVMAVGGGSRSALWLKMLATALAVPVDVPTDGDFGAAFGAARLGLIAAERADPASVLAVPAIAATHEPDASLSAAFAERLQRYRRLYPAIRSLDS